MSAQPFTLLPDDAPRQVRAVAAQTGLNDPHYRGELATIFDGRGRSLRYLRPRGVSLDQFGELLADRGITGRRLNPVELCDLLTLAFDTTNPPAKERKAPSARQVSDAEKRARSMRNRKFVCSDPECGQIARGTRGSSLICGICFSLYGRIVFMVRVDPLPEEIIETGR